MGLVDKLKQRNKGVQPKQQQAKQQTETTGELLQKHRLAAVYEALEATRADLRALESAINDYMLKE